MKNKIVFDIIFVVTVVICIVAVSITQTTANAEKPDYQPTSAPTKEVEVAPKETPTEIEQPIEETPNPSVTLYDVPLDEDLQIHIIETAEAHGIDPAIIFAMAFHESTYRADLIGDNGNSYGLLQVQPRWHRDRMERLGCDDMLNPYQNVTVAVDYLAEQIDKYGSLEKGIVAYNKGHYAGEITGYARVVLAKADELRGDVA